MFPVFINDLDNGTEYICMKTMDDTILGGQYSDGHCPDQPS